ncbi:hypothetical protein CBR_g44292 [Chara braunii]|uniref:Uncharacterized protein n=1 Tax=Chara braunii TaxID=69332 RepID=A0A388K2Z0_CHABU|nr:hypothetical protein CBR_g44292 [Chara braunii]|eukprot:GBG64408.1 hypothetical protein CBR_g44292 [Chara braunii]
MPTETTTTTTTTTTTSPAGRSAALSASATSAGQTLPSSVGKSENDTSAMRTDGGRASSGYVSASTTMTSPHAGSSSSAPAHAAGTDGIAALRTNVEEGVNFGPTSTIGREEDRSLPPRQQQSRFMTPSSSSLVPRQHLHIQHHSHQTNYNEEDVGYGGGHPRQHLHIQHHSRHHHNLNEHQQQQLSRQQQQQLPRQQQLQHHRQHQEVRTLLPDQQQQQQQQYRPRLQPQQQQQRMMMTIQDKAAATTSAPPPPTAGGSMIVPAAARTRAPTATSVVPDGGRGGVLLEKPSDTQVKIERVGRTLEVEIPPLRSKGGLWRLLTVSVIWNALICVPAVLIAKRGKSLLYELMFAPFFVAGIILIWMTILTAWEYVRVEIGTSSFCVTWSLWECIWWRVEGDVRDITGVYVEQKWTDEEDDPSKATVCTMKTKYRDYVFGGGLEREENEWVVAEINDLLRANPCFVLRR